MLWAVGQQLDFSSGLLFAFGLGNLNTIAIDLLRLRLSRQKPIVAWAMFTGAEIVLIPLFFLAVVAIGISLLGTQHMTGPVWHYVSTGWKIPLLLTFVFGVAYNFYRQASERLERRNRELEHAVKKGSRRARAAGAGAGAGARDPASASAEGDRAGARFRSGRRLGAGAPGRWR